MNKKNDCDHRLLYHLDSFGLIIQCRIVNVYAVSVLRYLLFVYIVLQPKEIRYSITSLSVGNPT